MSVGRIWLFFVTSSDSNFGRRRETADVGMSGPGFRDGDCTDLGSPATTWRNRMLAESRTAVLNESEGEFSRL